MRLSLRPQKAATDVLAQFAGEKFRFIAPDALLASDEQADWLVVDEAAAIPAPLLHQLVSRFSSNVVNHYGAGLRRHRTWFFAEILRSLSAFTPF